MVIVVVSIFTVVVVSIFTIVAVVSIFTVVVVVFVFIVSIFTVVVVESLLLFFKTMVVGITTTAMTKTGEIQIIIHFNRFLATTIVLNIRILLLSLKQSRHYFYCVVGIDSTSSFVFSPIA